MKQTQAKAKNIGTISGIPTRIIGIRDGKKGLPKISENGDWGSPVMERFNKAFAQRQNEEYRICAEKTRELQIRADLLSHEIRYAETARDEILDELQKSMSEASALTIRNSGEEHLPESGIRIRRSREIETIRAGKQSKLAAIEQQLQRAGTELAGILAEIAETETDTGLLVERVRANTDARILIYYHAALKNHPLREEMPPYPKLSYTNGEIKYISSRNANPERITTMQHFQALTRNGGK